MFRSPETKKFENHWSKRILPFVLRMGKSFPNEDDGKGRPNRLCEVKRIFAWVSARRSVCLDLRCAPECSDGGKGQIVKAEAGQEPCLPT